MITIRVPATSANVGPGFDTLGMALKLYNTYTLRKTGESITFVGVDEAYNNEDNIIARSMKAAFQYMGVEPFGIEVTVKSDIPVSRGLGSSASCIIGGILGAAGMVKKTLKNEEVLKIALGIEGHPDNITPALMGGMTIATTVGEDIEYMKLDIVDQYVFYAFIPGFYTSTEEARKILPEMVSMTDAVFNVSRASMLIASLISGKQQFLSMALEDKLHQSYRSTLINGYDELVVYMKEMNFLGNFISGAGPTVIGMAEKDHFQEVSFRDWTVKRLELDLEGAKIIND
jgi:homoserine kinase